MEIINRTDEFWMEFFDPLMPTRIYMLMKK